MADYNVVAGSVQNPYRQFPFSIAASETLRIQYDYNFFRFLSTSAPGLAVRFGQSGSESDIIGAGIGYELPEVVRDVFLRNTSGSTITGIVGMAIGRILDDRLNVSGNINAVVVTPTTLVDQPDVPVLTGATTLVAATDANTKSVSISNLAANGVSIRVGTSSAGAAQGAPVAAGGSLTVDNTDNVYVYNPSANTINIAVLFSRT